MADEILTSEQVAEIRETEVNCRDWDSPASPIPALCDTVDALRKRLNNLRHEQNRWVESDQAAMRREKKALQDVADLREQLRRKDLRWGGVMPHWTLAQCAEISLRAQRQVDAEYREADWPVAEAPKVSPAVVRIVLTEAGRALAEMGVSDD